MTLRRTMVRLDGALLENLDAVVIHLDQRCPAADATRTSVARELLRHALVNPDVLRRVGVDPDRLLSPK